MTIHFCRVAGQSMAPPLIVVVHHLFGQSKNQYSLDFIDNNSITQCGWLY